MNASGHRARLLFVYGSLLPGQSNWHVLAPWVADTGVADSAPGELYDTGHGWPAAVFGRVASRVTGRVYGLRPDTLAEALAVLDEFEGIHAGEYARIELVTDGGRTAWAYHSHAPGDAARVATGDWAAHVNKQNG